MKYIVVLGDGMADEPVPELGNKTPLDAAATPEMDALAGAGIIGTVQNVPSGMAPGSDVANLSVLGYDPAANYSGRSPLEALSVGVQMDEDDVIFRSNIVTLTESEPSAQKTIVVATVEGDIHDIGKNIVSLMLGNHGFKVVDLGKDVKAEAIVEAAVAHKADLIGLSALMTTTMVRMRDTVDLVKQRGLGVDVMVGGAVVTPAFAESIGANYSSDAVDAVRLAKSLIAARKNQ